MNLDLVFCRTSTPLFTPDGGRHLVQVGQHWPADDPVVLANPAAFTRDCRYGLFFSVKPDGYDAPVDPAPLDVSGARRTRRAA